MWQFLKIVSITLVFCLFSVAGWVGFMANSFMNTAPETPGKEVFVDVPPGAHLGQIADMLEEKGVVTSAFKFRLLARYRKASTDLQAGRFSVNTGWLPEKVLDTLVNGKPVLTRVTVPEGLTYWQTARILADRGYAPYGDLVAMARDPDFLRHYGIPFDTAEGFLMPDTYLLKTPEEEKVLAQVEEARAAKAARVAQEAQAAREAAQKAAGTTTDSAPDTAEKTVGAQATAGTEAAATPAPAPDPLTLKRRSQAWKVLGRLVDNFWQKAATCWPDGRKPAVGDLRRIVVLASIVEKETAVPSERPRVAGVYVNRIERGMLLQADPTVIYGKGEAFRGPITRSMLEDESNAYNTYRKAGLPPGPICSFGVSALKAAVSPEKHDFIYFVAVRDGGEHRFSKTLSEHNRAVRDYRRNRSQEQR